MRFASSLLGRARTFLNRANLLPQSAHDRRGIQRRLRPLDQIYTPRVSQPEITACFDQGGPPTPDRLMSSIGAFVADRAGIVSHWPNEITPRKLEVFHLRQHP